MGQIKPTSVPPVDEEFDWSALFGETPGADAYTRQLTELRGHAAKASRMAEKAAEDAEAARLVCKRVKALAVDIDERQREFAKTAAEVKLVGTIVVICAALVIVATVVRMAM